MAFQAQTYSAVNSKSKAMYGNRLTKEDYMELMKKKSVNEIASYLKNSPSHNAVLDKVNEGDIHRGDLEKLLKKEVFAEYNRLVSFTTGGIRKYLGLIVIRYEVELLKLIIRFISSDLPYDLMPDIDYYNDIVTGLDIKRLTAARSLTDLIEIIRDTPYYLLLKRYDTQAGDIDIFGIESSLDMYYMSTMWKSKYKYLTGADKDYVTHSLGSEIDTLNILWILRAKTYYHTINEMVYGLIIPHHYKLERRKLVALISAKSLEECLQIISTTVYKNIFKKSEDQFWEQNINEYMFRLNKAGLRKMDSISCIVAYIHLKEIEISNITSIIEGIRYNLDPEQIKKFVIGFHTN